MSVTDIIVLKCPHRGTWLYMDKAETLQLILPHKTTKISVCAWIS